MSQSIERVPTPGAGESAAYDALIQRIQNIGQQSAGTGFLFSRRILEQCGGWNFFLLTEDIEFTACNIVSGEKVGYCPTAVFYDEQPTGFRQSIRQRTRWVQGYLHRSHAP